MGVAIDHVDELGAKRLRGNNWRWSLSGGRGKKLFINIMIIVQPVRYTRASALVLPPIVRTFARRHAPSLFSNDIKSRIIWLRPDPFWIPNAFSEFALTAQH